MELAELVNTEHEGIQNLTKREGCGGSLETTEIQSNPKRNQLQTTMMNKELNDVLATQGHGSIHAEPSG